MVNINIVLGPRDRVSKSPLQVAGVSTNVDFLGRLASHQSFQEGDVHTGFIEVGVVSSVLWVNQ